MKRNMKRYLALVAAIVLAVFVVAGAKFDALAQHDHSAQSPSAAHDGHGQQAAPSQKSQDHSAHAQQAPPKPSGERKILYWYDPMHPQYKSDKPGTAPDCGMDLVPKYEDEVAAAGMTPGTVMVAPEKQALIGVRTAVVGYDTITRDVRTTATIAQNESRVAHVHVKVMGFVEDTFVNYVGEQVRKGQPLFTLYSPDLVATQEEYLIALRAQKELAGSRFAEVSNNADSLLRATRERLRLWDISDAQIDKLERTGQVQRTLTFFAPHSGTVMERKAVPHMSVTPEMELYTLADYSSVWVLADIFETDAPFVRVGMPATITLSYLPGKTYRGRVAFIAPTVDPMTRTLKARLEVANPRGDLKPGMFADVQFRAGSGRQLVIPQEAVMDTGNRQMVFVAGKANHFEPRDVKLGARAGDKVVVMSGLTAGETIVTSGNFLLDSESRMSSPGASSGQHQH